MSSRLNRGYIVAAKLFFEHKCDLMGSGVVFLFGRAICLTGSNGDFRIRISPGRLLYSAESNANFSKVILLRKKFIRKFCCFRGL